MQPNLKKEVWDKGREQGFYLGASKGASEAGEGRVSPACARAGLPLWPPLRGNFHVSPLTSPPPACEADNGSQTLDTHQVFQLETHFFPFKLRKLGVLSRHTEWQGFAWGLLPGFSSHLPAGGGALRALPASALTLHPGDRGLAQWDACGQSPVTCPSGGSFSSSGP